MVQHNWQESDPVELKQQAQKKKFRKNFKSIDRKKTLAKSRNTASSTSCPAFQKKKKKFAKHIKEAEQASKLDMTGVLELLDWQYK